MKKKIINQEKELEEVMDCLTVKEKDQIKGGIRITGGPVGTIGIGIKIPF
jgi:hypothetical protein